MLQIAREQLQFIIQNVVRFETSALEKSLLCSTYSSILGVYYWSAMDGLYPSRCSSLEYKWVYTTKRRRKVC